MPRNLPTVARRTAGRGGAQADRDLRAADGDHAAEDFGRRGAAGAHCARG